MKKLRSQRGQAIILLAFAIVGLVGFAALAIDGGRVLSDRRHAQNAADNSAFAAALAKVKGQNYTTAAQNRALSNGYNNGVNATVEVNLCSETGITCQGLPAGADASEYIRVKIRSIVPTTFARVIGRNQVENIVEAIAHASGITSNPLVYGAALASFQRTGTPFEGKGNGTLDVIGSGIFSNSTDTDCPNGAMKMGGSITYHVDTAYTAPGQICTVGGLVLDEPVETTAQVPIPDYDVPAPSFACPATTNPPMVGNQFQPGTYSPINISSDKDFAPGNYCFTGNVKITNGNITANNVNFRMLGGEFTTSGNSTITCSNMVFHSDGGSGITFNGGNNNCSSITFYLGTGGVHWTGNSVNAFTAPTSGIYKGLLIYLPNSNTSAITINGNSGSRYTGSVIAIGSSVKINGGSNTDGLHTQILANDIVFTGNGNTAIHYNPDELYAPPQYPTIELTK